MRKTGIALSLLIALWIVPFPAFANWTVLRPGPGARIVFVSSSEGNDANDGLSTATPKATMAAGFALMRNGQGDYLLLKRGDTFNMSTLMWNKSGASLQEPMVLGAYGSTRIRPVIDAGGGDALHISPGFQSPNTVRHLAIVGLHFRSSVRDFNQSGFDITTVPRGGLGIKTVGIQTTAPRIVENLLIEGCKFEFLGQGIVLEGPYAGSVHGVRLRRNVIVDTYAPLEPTNAVFVSNVQSLIMEENLIDGVQRAPGLDPVQVASSMSHAVYVQSTSRDVTLRNNIFARAYDGAMVRPGGVYEGNLVMDVTLGNHQGYMYSPSSTIITDGIQTRVTGNAFLKVRGNQGINAGNIRQGLIKDNVILSGAPLTGSGITLIGGTAFGQVGILDLAIEDNYVLGLRSLFAYGPAISNVTVRNNQFRAASVELVDFRDFSSGVYSFSGNTYYSQRLAGQWFWINGNSNYDLAGWTAFIGESGATAGSFVDPATAPDIESYHASIGGQATMTAFLDRARQQSQGQWSDQYTAAPIIRYLRQQLGLDPL